MPLTLALAIMVIFFVALPGAGAFMVRRSWRSFRSQVMEMARAPALGLAELRRSGEGRVYRYSGELEAIESEDLIWLKNDRLSVQVDMRKAVVYFLPQEAEDAESPLDEDHLPDEEPERVEWSRISSLSEGMRFFVGGPILEEGGRACFKALPSKPLLVIAFEGSERTLLRRAIWCGRHGNEYWNGGTPLSRPTGAFLQIMLLVTLWRGPLPPALMALGLEFAFSLLVPFLPPGVLLLRLYRSMWGKARRYRAERDLIMLAESRFENGEVTATLPGGGTYVKAPLKLKEGQALPPGMRLRAPDFARGASSLVAYGKPDPEGGVRLPDDPMAEFVAVPGEPQALSKACGKLARRWELAAFSCFGCAYAVNAALAYWGLVCIIA